MKRYHTLRGRLKVVGTLRARSEDRDPSLVHVVVRGLAREGEGAQIDPPRGAADDHEAAIIAGAVENGRMQLKKTKAYMPSRSMDFYTVI